MKKNGIAGIVTAAALYGLLMSCAGGGQPGDDSYDYYEMSEAMEDLAGQLQYSYEDTYEARDMDEPVKMRLAILNCVDADGNKTPIGKQISVTLQSKLFNPDLFSLLERERIAGLLEEYTFNNSGMVEEVSASELGKLLGAEIVLVTSYTAEVDTEWEETRYRINARIVNLETGEILGIGRVAYVVEEIE
jgi:curli biogenesis system outer membrane secretion channel CsgG